MSAYLQADAKPLRVSDAPADSIRQLFTNRAEPLSPSRNRILMCRDLRRNLLTVPIDPTWLDGNTALAKWIGTLLPERQMGTLNLTNTLGDEIPVISRHPIGQTDRAQDDADEAEVFIEGIKRKLVDWDEIIGTLVEDSELGIFVGPEPAGLEKCPDYMLTVDGDGSKSLRKPNPRYTRDKNGRGEDDPRYDGERSERASIKAWKDEYDAHLAEYLPVQVHLIKATDCAPIFGIGTKQRLECRGMIVRQLFAREDLLSQGFRSKILEPGALIPMGFSADRLSGQNGMFYLYTAYVYDVDEKTGEKVPMIARCVGGEYTELYNRHSDQNESAVINLKEEYGLDELMVGYFWGLHHSDDDPAWRGVPLMWPVLNTILGKEGLLQASKAHAHDNAFTGHVTNPNPALPEKLLLEAASGEKKPRKPKANEIVQGTGDTRPWVQAQIGDDVRWLLAEMSTQLVTSMPDPQQFGDDNSDSGHAMVVGHELLTSAKRHIKEGARLAVEFIIECAIKLLCGLARGKWKRTQGRGINATIAQDVERTISRNGTTRTVSEIIEFKERWFGNNYHITARYPAVGNLAEREQTKQDWKDGAGTWEEMRESRGDQSPETTRYKVARDQWFQGPIGQMVLAVEVAKERQMMELAAKLQQELDGQMAQIGLPVEALAPEFQGGAGGSLAVPNMAANSLNGTIQGQMGTASMQADAMAADQINPAAGVPM